MARSHGPRCDCIECRMTGCGAFSHLSKAEHDADVARYLAMNDARNFGTGYVRTHPDGRVEHIPPDEVTLFFRPNENEA